MEIIIIYSSGEARKAFGLYLGHILRKISQQNPDPICCDLVSKFLQQSASNLRTPFLFTVSILITNFYLLI
jgi:tubulin polyglutamylase TTLL5